MEKEKTEKGDFLEIIVFLVNFKLSLWGDEEEFVKKREVFFKHNLIYKILPNILHKFHGLGDTSRSLQLIFQICKYKNFPVLVIICGHILQGYGEVFLKNEIHFSQ